MTKRVISLLIVAIMVFALLTACSKPGTGNLSVEDAKKLVLQDLGIDKADSIDTHLTTIKGAACYLIYVSANGKNWQYTVNSLTSEIVDKEETDHAHSH